MAISFNNIRGALGLPAADIAGTVNDTLAQKSNLVVTAPPGAGKSTLLPLTILQGLATIQPGSKGKILMLEPRRLAARQIAERMASMLGEPVGKTVGYRIRMESRISKDTRIEVLTEGILTRMLVDDPTLEEAQVVIFDEFHERSLVSDVALALTREAQQVIRPDLRIVLMSATIDASALCQTLGADHVSCEGRMFPVETRLVGNSLPGSDHTGSVEDIASIVSHYIREAHRDNEGDILAFLPGEAEIRRCAEMLKGALGETHLCPLYGMLPPKEQQTAIAPSKLGERKVVLATPIAETSLTIEGVRVVVDSGLCRKMVFDQQTGLSHLETVQVSLDMADQRRGRAGRVAPGICYRLWTLATEHRMAECRTPEILEADLSPALLDIAAWGESQPMRLPWLTLPPSAHIAQASRLLQLLNAIDETGAITPHGRALAQLPCHPRIAQMLVLAQTAQEQALAADIAALLDEKDPLATTSNSADLRLRLSALDAARNSQHPSRLWARILQSSEQYRHLITASKQSRRNRSGDVDWQGAEGRFLASAYPERIAHALPEGCGHFRLASGDNVMLDPNDELAAHEWLAIASLNTQSGGIGHIFLAAPLNSDGLVPFIRKKDKVSWDSKQGCLLARSENRIGCLLVDSKPLSGNDPKLQQEILETLCNAARKEGTSMFDFNDEVGNFQRRIAAVASWHPELELPDLCTDVVLSCAEKWLPFAVTSLNKSLHALTVQDLKRIDLTQSLWMLLTYDQQQEVNQLAPTHIAVPTGSRIRVEYRQGAEAPILRVRLQECFGLTDTPRVDNGQRPVLMELLSPGFKPVQLTQDLHSFWEGTYFEVKKELKRRYPKHSWPDNPLEATAVRGTSFRAMKK